MGKNRAILLIGMGILGALLVGVEDQGSYSQFKRDLRTQLHDAMPKSLQVYADSGRDDVVAHQVEKVK